MKKRPYGDLEPKVYYLSKSRRTFRKRVRLAVFAVAIVVLSVLFSARVVKVARCAEAGGFIARDRCNGECCEVVTDYRKIR